MRYPKFMEQVNRFGAYACGAIVLFASALGVMESILRKFFRMPTSWSLNLTQGIFIWAAFLGSAWAFQELGHVSVDLIRDIIDKHTKGSKRWPRRSIALCGYLISFAVIAVFLNGGWKLCQRALAFHQIAPYNFRFPLIISYSAIVVGSLQMMVTLCFIMLDLLSGSDRFI